jgi:hypothetical protein
MVKVKYIIDRVDQFMIFSPTVQHIEAADLLMGDYGSDIVGAGFVYMCDGEVCCYGTSISLKINTRGIIDSKIIADSLGLKVSQ